MLPITNILDLLIHTTMQVIHRFSPANGLRGAQQQDGQNKKNVGQDYGQKKTPSVVFMNTLSSLKTHDEM